MSIRFAAHDKPTEADAGKYANPHTVFRDGFCARPVLITKVVKSRVYYRDSTRKWDEDFKSFEYSIDEYESFMKADSVVYICDTLEEATKLSTLSDEQMKEIANTAKDIREKYKKYVDGLLT